MVLIRSPDKGYCLVKIRYDWETTVRGGVGMLNQYDRHSPKENKNKRPRKWDGGEGGLVLGEGISCSCGVMHVVSVVA